MINFHRCCSKSLVMATVYFDSGRDVKWYGTTEDDPFPEWKWMTVRYKVNNIESDIDIGPTHLLSVPQMQALPWIKCRKGLSHPTKEQADSKAQRVRERKTPIYSFTALFSPSDLLSLPLLSYPLSLGSLFESFSLIDTHTLIEIHSLNSAHSQARVRQPHISPCSAPGWEERALQGAAITQDTGSRNAVRLDWGTWMVRDNLTRSRPFLGMELASSHSSFWRARQLVARLKRNTWVWNWSLTFSRICFTLSSHVPAFGFCVRQSAQRRPASCRLLVQGAPWETDPSCANGHLQPTSPSLGQPSRLILFPWYACPCSFWLALL